MLNIKTGRLIEEFAPSYVVFDLETTGISPYTDKVVEIAAVKVEDRKVTGEYSRLITPGCHIPEAASAVNGIYDEMVEREPSFDKILPEFIDFIGDFILVGHNIHAFDMNFIYRDAEAFLGKFPDNNYIDTLTISRKYMPEMVHHRMADLAMHFGISTEGAHRALKDCHMTQQVYELLWNEKKKYEEGKKIIPKCRMCGKEMRLRIGKYGEFWGCMGYPKCSYTENSR